MLTDDAMTLAIWDSSKGKRNRKAVQPILDNPKPKIDKLRQALIDGTWTPPVHKTSHLQEGAHKKGREIVKPRWDDEQIVHHMVVGQLMPIIMPRLYRHAYGSIPRAQFPKPGRPPGPYPPARGTHGIKDSMVKWVESYRGKRFYVAELDIRHFYGSIDHGILLDVLGQRIRDKRFLGLLDKIISPYDGLPLGHYTSPWLANVYLTAVDEYILQTLKPDHYARYMDNLYLFSTNKRKLHRAVAQLGDWLRENRRLEIKGSWQVYRFEDSRPKAGRTVGRAIDCVGFVIHRNHVGLRKAILKRIRAKALSVHRRRRLTFRDASAYLSYMGYIRHSNTYRYYSRYLKPRLTVRACKRRVSAIMRRRNNDRLENCSRRCVAA